MHGVLFEEIQLVLFPFQQGSFLRELLVFGLDDAVGYGHVFVIICSLCFALCLFQVVHFLAHLILELFTIQNLGSLDIRGLEVLFEQGMLADFRKGDTLLAVGVEDLLEKVLNLRCAVLSQFLL